MTRIKMEADATPAGSRPPRAIDTQAPQALPQVPAYADTLDDGQFATTLARGLEILRCFTPQDTLLGNKDLALRTGLPKPTVSRLTYTLSRLGYLRAGPRQRKYQLGSAVLSLSYPLLASISLRQLARPAMNALADTIGGSVSMGIRDRLNVVYIETSRSRLPAAPQFSDVGLAHPMAGTSIGRAYLAACDTSERNAILNEIRVKTPEQYARYADALRRSFDDYDRLGFCVCYDYTLPGIYGVGAPMKRRVNGEIVVFNCVVSCLSTRRARMEKDIGPQLTAMLAMLETTLSRAEFTQD